MNDPENTGDPDRPPVGIPPFPDRPPAVGPIYGVPVQQYQPEQQYLPPHPQPRRRRRSPAYRLIVASGFLAAAILAGGVGRTVVAVGHVAQTRTAVGQALGAPASHWARLRIPPASLSVVRLWEDGSAEVVAAGVPTDG